jgi:hypothetical protein
MNKNININLNEINKIKMSTDNSDTSSGKSLDKSSGTGDKLIEDKYVILMETTSEGESLYNFIRYEGNQDAIKFLQDQLETVEFYIYNEYSTFCLETDVFVSENTAKEMTYLNVNMYRHRKFDGLLQHIDCKLKPDYANKKKIRKINEVLDNLQDFVLDEDIVSGDEDNMSEDDEEDEDDEDDEDDEEDGEPSSVDEMSDTELTLTDLSLSTPTCSTECKCCDTPNKTGKSQKKKSKSKCDDDADVNMDIIKR